MGLSYSTQKDTGNSHLKFIKSSLIDYNLGRSDDKEYRERSKERGRLRGAFYKLFHF